MIVVAKVVHKFLDPFVILDEVNKSVSSIYDDSKSNSLAYPKHELCALAYKASMLPADRKQVLERVNEMLESTEKGLSESLNSALEVLRSTGVKDGRTIDRLLNLLFQRSKESENDFSRLCSRYMDFRWDSLSVLHYYVHLTDALNSRSQISGNFVSSRFEDKMIDHIKRNIRNRIFPYSIINDFAFLLAYSHDIPDYAVERLYEILPITRSMLSLSILSRGIAKRRTNQEFDNTKLDEITVSVGKQVTNWIAHIDLVNVTF